MRSQAKVKLDIISLIMICLSVSMNFIENNCFINIFSELSSADSLDLNVSPYMKAPQQQNYNPYPTLSKNSQSIASSLQQESSENELPNEPQTVVKRKNNKRRKINKSRRRKVKRRPNQKKTIPRKVGHF